MARWAGVSPITVSRALRTPDKVSKDTREKVDEAVRAVGYVPNLLAGSLASNRSNVVAALVPNIGNPLFAITLRGLSDTLRRRNFHLTVGSSDHSREQEEQLIRAVLGQRPFGLVLHETIHSQSARDLVARSGIPVIEIGDLVDHPMDTVVSFSNFEAAKSVALHLGRRGYRRIAFVASTLSARSDARRRGFEAGLAELGLQVEPSLETEAVSDVASGAAAIVELLTRHPDVDAVFFTANAAAVGASLECQRRGWAVPSRVALACFDDTELTQNMLPPLTAVRIPRYEIGIEAAQVLLNRLDGRTDHPQRIDVGFAMVQRGST